VTFIKGVGVIITFITPGRITAKIIVEHMSASGLNVDVLSRSALDLGQLLTPRQRDTLYTAISMGYFSPDRGTSLNEIAERLGVSKSTVSRQLRAAIRKLAVSALASQS